MMDSSDKDGTKEFLRRIALVTLRNKQKNFSKEIVAKQINKLKRNSLGRKTKEKIMGEFKDIEEKLEKVIVREEELLNDKKKQDIVYESMMQKIKEHNKKIQEMDQSFAKLNSGNRLKGVKVSKVDASPLKNKLKLLEKTYQKMKKSRKYTKNQLAEVKSQITRIKKKL